jgi:hypothetical protein
MAVLLMVPAAIFAFRSVLKPAIASRKAVWFDPAMAVRARERAAFISATSYPFPARYAVRFSARLMVA